MTNLFGFNVDNAISAMGDKFAAFNGGNNPFGAAGPESGSPFGMAAPSGGNPFGQNATGGGNPFSAAAPTTGNPFGAAGIQGGNPFGAAGIQGGNPFGAAGVQGGNPFGTALPQGGNPFGMTSPVPVTNPKVTVSTPTSTSTATGPSTGMTPGVAKWAGQTAQVFGDISGLDPDTMLAIMTNESGGDPNAYNKNGNAWGLFQNVGLGSNDPNVQFAAAHALALEKMKGINDAYAANGLNPDARQRAVDFALAWAGHFDYGTGRANPNSVDYGAGNQTAADLTAVFLKNYDAIKAGRTQPSGNIGGGTGGLPGITPGVQGSVMQEFGDTDYSNAHPDTYGYATAYGAHGHTGVDWAVARGTKVAAPVSGVVTLAGGNDGSGYYYTDNTSGIDADHKGELRIQLANGDILILGHMGDLTGVHVGQAVNPGDFVGLSGGSDGDHIHVEYRQKDPSMPSGYRIIDPRAVLR